MVIPAPMIQLHKSYTSFHHASGHQTISGESSRRFCIGAIQLKRGFGLVAQIGQARYAGLHPKGHLVLLHARRDLGIAVLFLLQIV